MQKKISESFIHDALATRSIFDGLRASSAVVLERISRGGGATNWYYCSDYQHLKMIEPCLSPGSVVSFYFDNRIKNNFFSVAVGLEINRILFETREVIVGTLNSDNLHIDIEEISGPTELSEYVLTLNSTSRVFYGAFPARDNDGVRAISVVLPDSDGIVREHPH